METKTKVRAGDGQQDIIISRDFELPVELLFIAHTDPEIFGQWMSHEHGVTKVEKLEACKHGSWRFETIDSNGDVLFAANGVIHNLVQNKNITRTFEMENTPFPVQLEFLNFEKLSGESSRLIMQIVYKSAEYRDQMLKMPFAEGLTMAHNRLQQLLNTIKK